MTDSHPSEASQLHPRPEYDRVADGNETAPDTTTRSAHDVGAMPSAGYGAVETEMTPLTPPSADTTAADTPAAGDTELDSAAEITPG